MTLYDSLIYRVSIKSFPDYKHLLQENYVEYKHIFFYHYLSQFLKFYVMCLLLCYSCITCQCQNGVNEGERNQGKTLCSPCRLLIYYNGLLLILEGNMFPQSVLYWNNTLGHVTLSRFSPHRSALRNLVCDLYFFRLAFMLSFEMRLLLRIKSLKYLSSHCLLSPSFSQKIT